MRNMAFDCLLSRLDHLRFNSYLWKIKRLYPRRGITFVVLQVGRSNPGVPRFTYYPNSYYVCPSDSHHPSDCLPHVANEAQHHHIRPHQFQTCSANYLKSAEIWCYRTHLVQRVAQKQQSEEVREAEQGYYKDLKDEGEIGRARQG